MRTYQHIILHRKSKHKKKSFKTSKTWEQIKKRERKKERRGWSQ